MYTHTREQVVQVLKRAWPQAPAHQGQVALDLSGLIETLSGAASDVWEQVLRDRDDRVEQLESTVSEDEGRISVLTRRVRDLEYERDDLERKLRDQENDHEMKVRDLENRVSQLQGDLDHERRPRHRW